jgi:hypothetical protein
MAGMFRRFIPAGVTHRWGTEFINNFTEDYEEGMYRTTGRFFGHLAKDLGQLKFAMMSEDWNSLDDTEKANIHRTLTEVSFILACIVLIAAMEGTQATGSTKDSWRYNFVAYQIYRLRAELAFYMDPAETLKILRTPAASITLVENTMKIIEELSYTIMSGTFEMERYQKGNEDLKGQMKIIKPLRNLAFPIYKQIYRTKHVGESISFFKQ